MSSPVADLSQRCRTGIPSSPTRHDLSDPDPGDQPGSGPVQFGIAVIGMRGVGRRGILEDAQYLGLGKDLPV